MVQVKIVTLDRWDLAEVERIARGRNDRKVEAGVRSNKVDAAKGELGAHLMGVRGEYAVGKLFGLPLDEDCWLHGDNGVDLEVAGYTFSVRTRGMNGWDYALMGTDTSEFNTDFGVLVWAPDRNPRSVTVAGWTTKGHFMHNRKPVEYIAGQRRWAMGPEKMFGIEGLYWIVRQFKLREGGGSC